MAPWTRIYRYPGYPPYSLSARTGRYYWFREFGHLFLMRAKLNRNMIIFGTLPMNCFFYLYSNLNSVDPQVFFDFVNTEFVIVKNRRCKRRIYVCSFKDIQHMFWISTSTRSNYRNSYGLAY